MRVRKRAWATQVLQENTLVINDAPEKKGKWREYFGNDNPIYVEIGCGKGGFLHDTGGIAVHRITQAGAEGCTIILRHRGTSLFDYQMTTLLEGARYMPSVFLTLKAAYHSGKFLGGILARR